jgi:DNA gyrase subunit A
VVINKLFKHTQLEDTFGINMLGLVNGEPMVLSLKQVMQHYLHHRQEVITRRTRYDLNLANQKKHILEGLKIAIDNLDAVIALIRNSGIVILHAGNW